MNAIDMTPYIAAKSDQLNADDIIGGPITIKVTRVAASLEGSDQPISVYYDGDNGKPFRPCKTARRIMVAVWGADASQYVGRSMTLYRDAEVMFGGLKVGGLRISHMSHMERETAVVVLKSKGKKAPSIIKPLAIEAPKPTEDRAAKWAASFCAKVKAAPDRVELEQLVEANSGRLDELSQKRPELHEQCAASVEVGRASFVDQSATDDDAFSEDM